MNKKLLVHLEPQMSLFAEKSWPKKHILSGLGHRPPPPYLEHSPKKLLKVLPRQEPEARIFVK